MACFVDDVRLGDEMAQSLQIQWGSTDAEHAVAEGAKSAQEMERGGHVVGFGSWCIVFYIAFRFLSIDS